MPDSPRKHRHYIGCAIILIGTIVAYLPAMQGEYVWDDDVHVSENQLLRNPRGLGWIWTKVGATPQYYPLTHTSFWLQYQLFGPGTLSFHLGNVILHAGSAITLWWILRRLGLKGAFFAALLFAWHPVHVESVAWISERKNTLSAFLYLLAGACAIRAFRLEKQTPPRPEMRWYLAMLACGLAAVFAKTIAGTLPAAIMLVAWWKRRHIDWKLALWLTPLWLAAIGMGRLTAHLEHTIVGAAGPEWNFSFAQRFLIAGRAVVFYIVKLVAPVDLTFNYPRWVVNRSIAWQWLFPAAVILLVGVLFLLRRRIGYGPLAALLFFIGTVFPALGMVNVYPMRFSFVADHFQYLASIGLLALLAELLVGRLKPSYEQPTTGTLVCAAIPLALLVLTFNQSAIYADAETLWTDTLLKNNRSWLARDHLAHLRLGQAAQAETLDARQALMAEAERLYRESLYIEPDHVEAYLGMANLRRAEGRKAEAIELTRRAVAIRPTRIAPLHQLGLLLESENPAEAIATYHKVLQIDERFEPSRLALARLLARSGRIHDAIDHCRRAIELYPAGVQSRVLLGDLYLNLGRKSEAREAYEGARVLEPNNAILQDRLRLAQP